MANASGLYSPAVFKKNAFLETVEHLANSWGCNPDDLGLTAYYSYGDVSDEKTISFNDTKGITGITSPLYQIFIWHKTDLRITNSVNLRRELDGVSILVSADDISNAQNLLNAIVETLGLSRHEPKFIDGWLTDRVKELDLRVSRLEESASKKPLKCFLSFRFSDKSRAIASEIEKYLTLLGAEVITGQEYEPRKVEDKVRERVLCGVDFVVYLITSEGESSWLRDELATAIAHGALPIPLIEEGCKLDEGLLGNIEHISFATGHPGDSWIRIAEAVKYVEVARDSNMSS